MKVISKSIISSIIIILGLICFLQTSAQEKTVKIDTSTINIEELNKELGKIKSLFEYYEKYDDSNASKVDKKNALDKAIDDMAVKGKVSEKDKSDSFKIIDAYIEADKEPSSNKPKDQKDKKDTQEVEDKALEYVDAAKNKLMSMSYDEYEKYIFVASPMLTKREVKESFNKLHKDDGKAVHITAADSELTQTQKEVVALEKMLNPKNYDDFREGVLFLKPDTKEDEIRKAWNNR